MSVSASSSAFNISAVLAFTTQPGTTAPNTAFTAVVTVRDPYGATVTSYTGNVTVALFTNPAGGTLSGTTTVACVAGVATFSTLKIDTIGNGYVLSANSTDTPTGTVFAQVFTSAFNISNLTAMVIFRSAQNKFATIDWSGNLVQQYDNSATAFAGTNIVGCLGTTALTGTTGNTIGIAPYGISTADFSVLHTGTNVNQHTNVANLGTTNFVILGYWPASTGGSIATEKYDASLADVGAIGAINITVGAYVDNSSQFVGVNGTLYFSNRDLDFGTPQWLVINPTTGAVQTIAFPSAADLVDGMYMCMNSTKIVRPILANDPTIEVVGYSGITLTTLQTLALFTASPASAYKFLGMVCDDNDLIVVVENTTTGHLHAYHYDFATYTKTDITTAFLSGLTEANLITYMANSRMCAIGLTY